MFYLRVRSYLILIFLIMGIVLHIETGLKGAWYLYAASAILLVTHILFGSVWVAFRNLQKGKLDEAEVLLNGIRRPQWLAKSPRAYYHFTKGMIALQKKELDEGAKHLEQAMETGLRTGNDSALAALNLAHICYVEKRVDESKGFLKKAKSFDSNDLMIRQNIEKLEKALAQSFN
ncbi:MAG: hypothetical protein AAFV95_19640 [Bacteroidota bacterium]